MRVSAGKAEGYLQTPKRRLKTPDMRFTVGENKIWLCPLPLSTIGLFHGTVSQSRNSLAGAPDHVKRWLATASDIIMNNIFY